LQRNLTKGGSQKRDGWQSEPRPEEENWVNQREKNSGGEGRGSTTFRGMFEPQENGKKKKKSVSLEKKNHAGGGGKAVPLVKGFSPEERSGSTAD